jgi:serine/threonine-protein kinase
VLGLLLAVVVTFLIPSVRERFLGLAYASSQKHIAVLPFTNSSGDPAFQLVAEGLMDSMTNDLSNLQAAQQSLWVVPASVVRNRHVSDPASAFRDLGATMVVQGSVSRKNSDVSLPVLLIDSKHLRQIGSAQFEDHSGNLAAIQNQAVVKLASMMKVSTDSISNPAGTVAAVGYESYLKALGYLQRYDKPGNPVLAIAELKSAVEKNPRFALGYATLGEAYRLKFLMDHQPRGEVFRYEGFYFYGHYYAVQAMWHAGGRYWREWFPAIRDELLGRQAQDGSWPDLTVNSEYGTAMACIVLQMPNGYLPIFQR